MLISDVVVNQRDLDAYEVELAKENQKKRWNL